VANLCALLLGPGTSITHAAVGVCAENGCSIVWCGQDGTHYYAQGGGETRKAWHLLHQAKMVSDPVLRTQVVKKMYEQRFGIKLDPMLTIEQVRGMEGARVRNAYREASASYGVDWQGRKYDRTNWQKADPINRAISAANAVLYGVCHAGIVSGGYSAGMGFLHTGWQLSFVYDIADLYKTEITIPVAFQTTAEGETNISNRTRAACRERIRETKLLTRILPDIDALLAFEEKEDETEFEDDAFDPADYWWQPVGAQVVEGVTDDYYDT